MSFRKSDVPYMTSGWKNAIKLKRKYAKQYANNRTNENWELKRRWRNIAKKYRRQVIQEYWQRKTEDLKAYPREFYKTFRPFLSEQEADYRYLHGYLHTRNDRF